MIEFCTQTAAFLRQRSKPTLALPTRRLVSLFTSLGLGLVFLALTQALVWSQGKVEWTLSTTFPADDTPGYDYAHPPQEPAEAITLTREPYLQSVTTNSVVVVWDTDQPTTSRVDYGPTAAHGLVVSDVTSVTHHALTLAVSSPYSVYHYQISSNGQLLDQDNTFRTAALPTQTTFSFVAFGDTRTGILSHTGVVSRIISLAPDFVLHTGDFVEDGNSAAEWNIFFEIEHNLLRQSPLFGALGNHEMNSGHYFDAFHLPNNEHWYSFDYGNAHFVALQVDGYADYRPGSPQYTWLENDLSSSNKLWKVVFFHWPPYSTGPHGSYKAVRYALGPLFAEYGVDLVFNGHEHNYERSIAGDTVYIITGGGGAPLYDQVGSNPYSVYFAKTHHCVFVSIDRGTLVSVGVRPDGTQFDLFTLYKPVVGDYLTYLPLILRGHGATGSTLLPPPP